ncbi:MAG TPA: FtsX-like permease family protein [Actinomycetota bacterium]
MIRRVAFWLRWSRRDLRARWLQVAAIALIVAIGSGMFAALGSLATWRRISYDESYSLLNAHDVHVSLPAGSWVPSGTLVEAIAHLRSQGVVTAAEERVVLPTQVNASFGGRTILVPGVVIGLDLGARGPHLNKIFVTGGRALRPADAASPGAAVLEAHFADHYELPPSGEIRMSGGQALPYVGTGYAPEYFMVTTEAGGFLAESNFAAVFVPLEVAQAIVGEPVVNDLVLEVALGVDRAHVVSDVSDAIRASVPGIALTVTPIDDDPAYRALYGDLDNDQRTMNAVAALILAASVFAAFNLTSRVVEAQRREIGIGMALGERTSAIATRPLLMGLEIGLLGAVFGIGVGLLIDEGLRAVLESMQPMPVWETTFQAVEFAKAAALGLILPLLATVWPVWRAVRVTPVEAIRTGHLAARGGRIASVMKRVTGGRRSLRVMPLRNVLRSPRRTLLTAVGIAASITAMVGVIGMVDSFDATIDRGAAEIERGAPGRLEIALTTMEPIDGTTVRAIEAARGVAATQPSLRLAGRLGGGSEAFDVILEVLDLDGAVWNPTIEDRISSGAVPGIVLARKAARDLAVLPGDLVTVTHPLVDPENQTFLNIATRMRVLGVHPNPMRSLAFVDIADADMFGLVGMANTVHVAPAEGATAAGITRELFGLRGVASVQPANATVALLRDLMVRFLDILRFVEIFVLVLALLIAFNAASIAVDERAREHATMSAFGVRTRTIIAGLTEEGIVVGVLGTAIGVAFGSAAVRWLMAGTGQQMPDLDLISTVTVPTIATAFMLGVAAVGLAPLFSVRRLVRMDIPSTLRVME